MSTSQFDPGEPAVSSCRVSRLELQALTRLLFGECSGNDLSVFCHDLAGTLSGWWTMWLWRAAYASDCASMRTKLLVVGDWLKAYVFGRDSSRI